MKIISKDEKVKMKVSGGSSVVPFKPSAVVQRVEKYNGVYEVTPTDGADIELLTAHKMMEQNVVVHEIPYYETHNAKGTTVIIGE